LEHVQLPGSFAAELGRIIRPGGLFLALTPSRFHYVSLIASCTPTRFHQWVNERRGRERQDTFPTQYRLNDRRQIERHFGQAGFELIGFDSFEVQPNYLKFSRLTFLLGAAYERVVNALNCLSSLRVNFTCALRNTKKDSVS